MTVAAGSRAAGGAAGAAGGDASRTHGPRTPGSREGRKRPVAISTPLPGAVADDDLGDGAQSAQEDEAGAAMVQKVAGVESKGEAEAPQVRGTPKLLIDASMASAEPAEGGVPEIDLSSPKLLDLNPSRTTSAEQTDNTK